MLKFVTIAALAVAATLGAEDRQLAIFSQNTPGTYQVVPAPANKSQIAIYGISCNSQWSTGIDLAAIKLSLVSGSQQILPVGHAPIVLPYLQGAVVSLRDYGLVTCFLTYSYILAPHYEVK